MCNENMTNNLSLWLMTIMAVIIMILSGSLLRLDAEIIALKNKIDTSWIIQSENNKPER